MIKFSIIIPIYNAREYIGRCIESILNQEYTDFEVILVDDGSVDDSFSICCNYAQRDKRLIPISKANGGPGSARNEGLKNISGDYVCFVDADDEVSSKWLSNYTRFLKKNEIDICFQNFMLQKNGNLNLIYGDLDSIIEDLNLNNPQTFKQFFEKKWILLAATWSKCYRASLIKDYNITFNEKIKNFEDFLFFIHALEKAKTISLVKGTGYVYNYVSNSLSRTNDCRQVMLRSCSTVLEDRSWQTNNILVKKALQLFLKSLPISSVNKTLTSNHKKQFAKYLISNKIYVKGLRYIPYNIAITLKTSLLVRLMLNLQNIVLKE